MVSGGVIRRWPPRRTADVTGVPSACSGPCAAIPGVALYADLPDTTSTLCRLPLYFFLLQDPRRAWATTLGHGTALDRGKTMDCGALDALPHPTRAPYVQ